jgi:DNA-directed RNA polymerase beta' subunit
MCEECASEQMQIHLSSENPRYFCNDCSVPAEMIRALTTPHIIKKSKQPENKVGKLTEEYIEANKQILKEEKQKAKENTYEQT